MAPQIGLSSQFRNDVVRWARGQATWAQVEGFTSAQAKDFAETACELARRGQLKKAAVIFEGLVALNPRDHASQAALGTVYQRLLRPKEARVAYDRALAVCRTDVVALAHRGELRIVQGDSGGIEDLHSALEVDSKLVSAAARRAKTVLGALRQGPRPKGRR